LSRLGSREVALLAVRYALDRKAYDLLLLEIGEISSLADYFLICTARSDTQAQAIAESIRQNLAAVGVRPLLIEGYQSGQWILMDYGDVAVHVFLEDVRAFYDLERLWARAKVVELPEPYRSQAEDLRLVGAAR
jgi:ribosome-associated protein